MRADRGLLAQVGEQRRALDRLGRQREHRHLAEADRVGRRARLAQPVADREPVEPRRVRVRPRVVGVDGRGQRAEPLLGGVERRALGPGEPVAEHTALRQHPGVLAGRRRERVDEREPELVDEPAVRRVPGPTTSPPSCSSRPSASSVCSTRPPGRLRASSTTTSVPAAARSRAAERPASPAPSTATSWRLTARRARRRARAAGRGRSPTRSPLIPMMKWVTPAARSPSGSPPPRGTPHERSISAGSRPSSRQCCSRIAFFSRNTSTLPNACQMSAWRATSFSVRFTPPPPIRTGMSRDGRRVELAEPGLDPRQRLLERGDPRADRAELVAVLVVVLLEPAGADAEDRAAAGDVVERAVRVGEVLRVAVAVADHERAELDPLGHLGHRAEHGQRLEVLAVRRCR